MKMRSNNSPNFKIDKIFCIMNLTLGEVKTTEMYHNTSENIVRQCNVYEKHVSLVVSLLFFSLSLLYSHLIF